ncbi:MAG: alpha/beta hydrolase, partial [Bryobacterales bacterium]|nr:alpha/beta hydrolase [Bryobacterales bacterium]
MLPRLEEHFTVVAVARRGRGETDATEGHTLDEEAADVVSIIEALGEPVFLLGHSYGGHVALRATASVADRVRKLVLYEAPWPTALGKELADELERLGEAGRWDEFSWTFFHRGLCVPAEELERLRAEGLWEPIVGDAKASLGDLRALAGYRFEAEQYRGLQVSTLLQTGSESP